MNADGSNIRFLTYGTTAQFSPDGSKIYFGKLNSINIDGTGLQQIIPQSLSVYDYTISGDGKEVAFSTINEFYLMNIDGSGLIKLISIDTSFKWFYTEESFSPNDSLVAYRRSFGIGIINSDGSNKKALLPSDSITFFSSPVFTPDGIHLLYVRYDNYYKQSFICSFNLKTSTSNQIYSGQPVSGIQVAPDDFAYFSANGWIQKLDLSTNNAFSLVEGYQESFSKNWNKIIYTKPNDPDKAIYIYDMVKGDVTTIKPGFQWAVIQYPKISPDGNYILFEADSTYIDGYLFSKASASH